MSEAEAVAVHFEDMDVVSEAVEKCASRTQGKIERWYDRGSFNFKKAPGSAKEIRIHPMRSTKKSCTVGQGPAGRNTQVGPTPWRVGMCIAQILLNTKSHTPWSSLRPRFSNLVSGR